MGPRRNPPFSQGVKVADGKLTFGVCKESSGALTDAVMSMPVKTAFDTDLGTVEPPLSRNACEVLMRYISSMNNRQRTHKRHDEDVSQLSICR